jgi:hypothetical protein
MEDPTKVNTTDVVEAQLICIKVERRKHNGSAGRPEKKILYLFVLSN